MSKQQASVDVLEGNILISIFMELTVGTIYHYPPFGGSPVLSNHLKYHSSWDWLMPAVKKAKELPIIKGKAIEQMNYWEYVEDMLITLDINNVFNGLTRYITWYNTQTKKQ